MVRKILISLFFLLISMVALQALEGWGDVNGDGVTNIIDALCIAQAVVGQTPAKFDPVVADVDNNGRVTVVDALMVARYCVGLYEPPQNQAVVDVEPNDPAIYYTGRIDFRNPLKPAFAYSGVSIKARFTGTGIDVCLQDVSDRNYFNVMIDGGETQVIRTTASETTYNLARDLAGGTHTIEIFKRTEGNLGKTVFLGFTLYESSGLMPWGERPARKMEFIGDSITCGYGNEISTNDPASYPFKPENENAYMSYGAMAARDLDAEFWAMCFSGKGLFRNYNGSEANTIPDIYDRVFPEENIVWDYSGFSPDIVVINLGTNDYSSVISINDLTQAEMDARIESRYLELIADVRSRYGRDARIVCAVGPMMGDSYPAGQMSWTRIRNLVSSMVADSGDSRLHYLCFDPQSAPYGEDWHPTIATHRQMADRLVALIRQLTGW